MAKRSQGKPPTANGSLILASAESLGRLIGALQRQLGVAPGASSNGSKQSKATKKKKRPTLKAKATSAPKSKGRS